MDEERYNMLTKKKYEDSYIGFWTEHTSEQKSIRSKEGNYVIIKGSILLKDITILMCMHLTRECQIL